jgi:hypothetical protein
MLCVVRYGQWHQVLEPIPPPDPNPTRPHYVPPAHACDSHCHIFGPARLLPYALERCYTPPDTPKSKLAALHAHLGLSRDSGPGFAARQQLQHHARGDCDLGRTLWHGVAMVGATR